MSPEEHARRISDAVLRAWFAANSSRDHSIPLSVVAALALIRRPLEEPDVGAAVLALTEEEARPFLRSVWAQFVRVRPDLGRPVYPLVAWLAEEPDTATRRAALAVARAAVRTGQLHLTGDPDRVREVDLFGILWQDITGRRSQQATGQFFTPRSIADCMARLVGTPDSLPQAGQSVLDPTVGTGGLLRSFSETVRTHGVDSRTLLWFGMDVEPLVLALCAVNAHIWDLGPNAVLALGDSLRADGFDRAIAERDETIRAARTAQELGEIRTLLGSLGIADFPASRRHPFAESHDATRSAENAR